MSEQSLSPGPKPVPEPAFLDYPAIDNRIAVALGFGVERRMQRDAFVREAVTATPAATA